MAIVQRFASKEICIVVYIVLAQRKTLEGFSKELLVP